MPAQTAQTAYRAHMQALATLAQLRQSLSLARAFDRRRQVADAVQRQLTIVARTEAAWHRAERHQAAA